MHDSGSLFTAPCIARNLQWQDVRPSILLSVTRQYSVETVQGSSSRFKIPPNFFHHRVGTPFYFLQHQILW